MKNTESSEESKESEGIVHEATEPFVNDDSEEIILLPKHRETNDNSRQFRFMKIMVTRLKKKNILQSRKKTYSRPSQRKKNIPANYYQSNK